MMTSIWCARRREWASVFSVEGPHGETVRVLDVGGAYQSATYLGKRRYEPVFEYYRSFDAAFSCGIPVRRALMIGGGGCAWPKHAAATRRDVRIDVLEEDPHIIDIARRRLLHGRAGAGGRAAADRGGRALLPGADRTHLRRDPQTTPSAERNRHGAWRPSRRRARSHGGSIQAASTWATWYRGTAAPTSRFCATRSRRCARRS